MFKRFRSKKHLRQVADMGCVICGNEGVAHHILIEGHGIMGSKAADSMSFCLCNHHHLGDSGLHTLGVLAWESQYGSQWKHLAKTLAMIVEER